MTVLTPAQDKTLRLMYAKAKRVTYPVEMHDFSPRQVAEMLWPDSPAWEKRTRFRATSNQGALGGTMPMNAAKILWRLKTAGMVQEHNYLWHLSYAGVRYVEGLAKA